MFLQNRDQPIFFGTRHVSTTALLSVTVSILVSATCLSQIRLGVYLDITSEDFIKNRRRPPIPKSKSARKLRSTNQRTGNETGVDSSTGDVYRLVTASANKTSESQPGSHLEQLGITLLRFRPAKAGG